MYVLSIPALFIWKKIDLVNYPNEWGIARMACTLTRRDRMNSALALFLGD